MRFLWQSNAPWCGTGYGVQTNLVLRGLKQAGQDPVCFCFYGLSGGKVTYDGYECLPGSNFEQWGNDVIAAHLQRSKAELVVTLIDLFVLDTGIWNELSVPWVAWVPIDSHTLGDMTIERLRVVDFPVAMSQFGAQQMRDAEIEPAATIYHIVDTEVFKPGDKAESRELLTVPQDAFVVGMVMANKGNRKQFPLQLQAVKLWQDKNPDIDVRVYLHTEPTSAMGGYDIKALVDKIGLSGKVFSTNQYDASVVPMNPEGMAKIYNSFDVLMNCSMGEGFGVPIAEAQACGIPVITTGATAMPELTQNGYTVEVQNVEMGLHMGWMFVPNIEDMVYRLDCVYRMSDKARAEAGRTWVIQNCSSEVIIPQWDALLETIRSELVIRVGDRRQVLL